MIPVTIFGTILAAEKCPARLPFFYKVTDLSKVLKEVKDAHEQTKAEVVALKCEASELKDKMNELNKSRSYSGAVMQRNPEPVKKSTLLIGDSTIRDIDEEKMTDTSIKCYPGATLERVRDELLKLKETHTTNKIVVVAGTNDCAKDDVLVNDALEDASNLIQTARSMADEVVISSICPCLDKDREHLSAFNAGLQSLCEEKECSLIDSTPSFTL